MGFTVTTVTVYYIVFSKCQLVESDTTQTFSSNHLNHVELAKLEGQNLYLKGSGQCEKPETWVPL